jgi:SAM-dependent methyltransferase
MGGSVGYDRAADFYDASRAISVEAMERTVRLLATELRGRPRALEIGIGTGLLALPLREAGVQVAGVDLSGPMLSKLIEKAGGRAPFPLTMGDATRMPFADDAFGAAYLRWVLHLIPEWRSVVSEVVRVVRPGGVFLANLGAYGGTHKEIQERFEELTGVSTRPVGLMWAGFEELDAVLRRHGAGVRVLPPLDESFEQPLDDFIRGIEENRYSWTWRVPEDVRAQAAAEIRPWAERRFGSLDVPRSHGLPTLWRAYDLPERPI